MCSRPLPDGIERCVFRRVSRWTTTPHALILREELATGGCGFNGLAFGLGLLLGVVLTSLAFVVAGFYWARCLHAHTKTAGRTRPHHIITEPILSPHPTMRSAHGATRVTQAPQPSPSTATSRYDLSSSESALPLARRDVHGKFFVFNTATGNLGPDDLPPEQQRKPREKHISLGAEFGTGFNARTSITITAEESTEAESVPLPPMSDVYLLPSSATRERAVSIDSLLHDSVSSTSSTFSGRTRILVGPPPLPPPSSPLPTPPAQQESFSLSATSQQQQELRNSLRHLPEVPTGTGARRHMSAFEEKMFLDMHSPDTSHKDRDTRRDTMPPAYSRPPSPLRKSKAGPDP